MLVKIPETRNPFTVIFNGVEYAYQAGKEVEVSDAIGELILNAVKATDQLSESDEVVPPFGSGDTGPVPYSRMPDGYPKVISEKEVVILEETVVEMPSSGYANLSVPIESGKTYIMYFDHVAYECKAITIQGTVAAGNLSTLMGTPVEGSNDDAPFVYATANGGQMMIIDPDYTGNPTFSIVEKIREITPMAAEFLPSGAGSMRINITEDDKGNYVADRTYAEIVDAIRNGILPYCVNGTLVLHLASASHGLSNVSATADSFNVEFIGFSYLYMHRIKIDEDDSVFYHGNTLATTTT